MKTSLSTASGGWPEHLPAPPLFQPYPSAHAAAGESSAGRADLVLHPRQQMSQEPAQGSMPILHRPPTYPPGGGLFAGCGVSAGAGQPDVPALPAVGGHGKPEVLDDLGMVVLELKTKCLQLRSFVRAAAPPVVIAGLISFHRIMLQLADSGTSGQAWAPERPERGYILMDTSSQVIAALADIGLPDEAAAAFWRGWQAGLGPSPAAVQALFVALGRSGRADAALTICRQFAAMPSALVLEDAMRALLSTLWQPDSAGTLAEAQRLMVSSGKMSLGMQNALIEATLAARAEQVALPLLLARGLPELACPLKLRQRQRLSTLLKRAGGKGRDPM